MATVSLTGSKEEQPEIRDAIIHVQNKNIAAFWLLFATQIFYSFMYGFYIDLSKGASQKITDQSNFVHTALLFILIIIGFGMILGYYSKMGWSALGFNLLITVLVIETYFLVNAFWTKTQLYYSGQDFITDPKYYIFLTSSDQIQGSYAAVLTQALKCSLACIVAFSFILGRAGPLQVYFVSVIGTIIYELTRQICLIRSTYEPGSLKIFLFGSTFGLMLSILMRRSQTPIRSNSNHKQTSQSITFCLIGLLIYWVLFPLLSFDSLTDFPNPKLLIGERLSITEPLIICVVLSIASATIVGIAFSFFQFGFKSVVTCSLAGGIVALSSSAYITNPAYAILWGIVAALFQQVFLLIDHKIIQKIKGPIDSFSYVFLVQGVLGLIFSAINRAIVQGESNNLELTLKEGEGPGLHFGNSWVFAAIGLAVGIFLGILFSCCTYHDEIDHFNDYTYWKKHDGISTYDGKQTESDRSIQILERSNIKGIHSYL